MLHETNLRCDGIASKQNFRLCATECLRQILERQLLWGSLCSRRRIKPGHNLNV